MMMYRVGMFSSNQITPSSKFLGMVLILFLLKGVSLDKTGGAVLLAEGSDKTENSVPRVLLASWMSHSLFCFCFCHLQGSA